jgi:hypothetical protein
VRSPCRSRRSGMYRAHGTTLFQRRLLGRSGRIAPVPNDPARRLAVWCRRRWASATSRGQRPNEWHRHARAARAGRMPRDVSRPVPAHEKAAHGVQPVLPPSTKATQWLKQQCASCGRRHRFESTVLSRRRPRVATRSSVVRTVSPFRDRRSPALPDPSARVRTSARDVAPHVPCITSGKHAPEVMRWWFTPTRGRDRRSAVRVR